MSFVWLTTEKCQRKCTCICNMVKVKTTDGQRTCTLLGILYDGVVIRFCLWWCCCLTLCAQQAQLKARACQHRMQSATLSTIYANVRSIPSHPGLLVVLGPLCLCVCYLSQPWIRQWLSSRYVIICTLQALTQYSQTRFPANCQHYIQIQPLHLEYALK